MKRTTMLLMLILAATGFLSAQIPWPVPAAGEANPQPVRGTLGELRKPPLSSAPHLHNGVDIAAPEGTEVFAVESGCVGQVLHPGMFLESVRIGDFTYVHVAVSTQLTQGACVSTGTLVGQTNSANHVHLIWHGSGGLTLNPLLALANYSDSQPPAAPTDLALLDNQGDAFPQLNSGDYILTSPQLSIEAEAGDIEGGNTLGVFELCSNLIGISAGASAGLGQTCNLLFPSLPAEANVNLVYNVNASTVENGNVDLIYNVTNFSDSEGFLDTSSLVPGRYKLTIVAKDIQSASAGATKILSGPESTPDYLIKPAVLTINISGTGSGMVTLSPVQSFVCGPNCYQIVDFTDPITLTAQPGQNSAFTGWSGNCAGSGASISLVVSQSESCTATFTAQQSPSFVFVLNVPVFLDGNPTPFGTTSPCDQVSLSPAIGADPAVSKSTGANSATASVTFFTDGTAPGTFFASTAGGLDVYALGLAGTPVQITGTQTGQTTVATTQGATGIAFITNDAAFESTSGSGSNTSSAPISFSGSTGAQLSCNGQTYSFVTHIDLSTFVAINNCPGGPGQTCGRVTATNTISISGSIM